MSERLPDFILIHECAAQTEIGDDFRFYGSAIWNVTIDTRDLTAWVDNREYASRVLFCPYCGTRLAPDPVSDCASGGDGAGG